jgi:hypothetical protein
MRAWNVPRAGAEVWLSGFPVPEGTMLVSVPARHRFSLPKRMAGRR